MIFYKFSTQTHTRSMELLIRIFIAIQWIFVRCRFNNWNGRLYLFDRIFIVLCVFLSLFHKLMNLLRALHILFVLKYKMKRRLSYEKKSNYERRTLVNLPMWFGLFLFSKKKEMLHLHIFFIFLNALHLYFGQIWLHKR